MKQKNDVLPESFADPMLMDFDDLKLHAEEFERAGNSRAANFLLGVFFARISMRAAGVEV